VAGHTDRVSVRVAQARYPLVLACS